MLRNTSFVYGIVLYVGSDTKIMRCVCSGRVGTL